MRQEEEWHLYESALILEIDTSSGSVQTRVEYKTPPEACPNEKSSNVFKSGSLAGNKLYVCTSTEVLTFQLPKFELANYISLPCFNDLHHVTPDSSGSLLVASTGLEMVVKVTLGGQILRQWNVLGEDPWCRFSQEIDYRKVHSTKPHRSHPNYVFELDGEIWVTRFVQRDAICLTKPGKCIDIRIETPHDGLVRGDRIYFTTVDGRIVIVNRHSIQVEEIVDLKEINGQKALLGWCRGLLPLDESRCWVGFTRVRKTKFRENVLWIRNILRDEMFEKPTHLAIYDISARKCLQEFDLERHGMNVVFSIFPVAEVFANEDLLFDSAGVDREANPVR